MIRAVVRDFAEAQRGLDRDQVVGIVEALWEDPVHERRMAAVELLGRSLDVLDPGDLDLVERLIREPKTWALVDPLSATVAGGLVERFPELLATLDRWAADGDFWVRRAALLALLGPLRRGEGDFQRFGRYADSMLEEREFFIRKAVKYLPDKDRIEVLRRRRPQA